MFSATPGSSSRPSWLYSSESATASASSSFQVPQTPAMRQSQAPTFGSATPYPPQTPSNVAAMRWRNGSNSIQTQEFLTRRSTASTPFVGGTTPFPGATPFQTGSTPFSVAPTVTSTPFSRPWSQSNSFLPNNAPSYSAATSRDPSPTFYVQQQQQQPSAPVPPTKVQQQPLFRPVISPSPTAPSAPVQMILDFPSQCRQQVRRFIFSSYFWSCVFCIVWLAFWQSHLFYLAPLLTLHFAKQSLLLAGCGVLPIIVMRRYFLVHSQSSLPKRFLFSFIAHAISSLTWMHLYHGNEVSPYFLYPKGLYGLPEWNEKTLFCIVFFLIQALIISLLRSLLHSDAIELRHGTSIWLLWEKSESILRHTLYYSLRGSAAVWLLYFLFGNGIYSVAVQLTLIFFRLADHPQQRLYLSPLFLIRSYFSAICVWGAWLFIHSLFDVLLSRGIQVEHVQVLLQGVEPSSSGLIARHATHCLFVVSRRSCALRLHLFTSDDLTTWPRLQKSLCSYLNQLTLSVNGMLHEQSFESIQPKKRPFNRSMLLDKRLEQEKKQKHPSLLQKPGPTQSKKSLTDSLLKWLGDAEDENGDKEAISVNDVRHRPHSVLPAVPDVLRTTIKNSESSPIAAPAPSVADPVSVQKEEQWLVDRLASVLPRSLRFKFASSLRWWRLRQIEQTLFSDVSLYLDAIRALGALLVAAAEEDHYGLVQPTLQSCLISLLELRHALRRLQQPGSSTVVERALQPLSSIRLRDSVNIVFAAALALEDAVENAIRSVVATYGVPNDSHDEATNEEWQKWRLQLMQWIHSE